MNPEEVWDAFAAKFGQDVAQQRLGARPARPAAQPTESTDRDRPGILEGSVRAATSGATFGTNDELAGALSAVGAGARRFAHRLPGGADPNDDPTAGEAYRGTRDRIRGRERMFREDHPVLSFGAELAGGVATGFGAGRVAKTTVVGAKAAARGAGRVLAEGVAAGAATGAGTAEGGVRERAAGAVKGGAVGGGFSLGLRGLGRFGSALLDRTGLRPRGAPAAGASGAAAGAANAGPTAPAAPPSRFAHRVTDALGVESVEDRANRKILERMANEEVTPQDIRNLRLSSGKPIAVGDAGSGKGDLVALAAEAQSLPGKQKGRLADRFRARAEGELGRLKASFSRFTGMTQEFAEDTAENIVRRRASQYGPEYERVLGAAGAIDDPRVTKLLGSGRSSIERGIEAARKIASEEGREAFVEGQPLTARDLHYLKLGVDDVLRGMSRSGEAGGAKGTLYARMNATKSDLLSLLDDVIPGYQNVRAKWAGESSMLDALGEGAELFDKSTDWRSVTKRLAKMTPDEREMYRRGALDDLLYRLGDLGDGFDRSRRVIGTPNLKEKVALLFDDPAAAEAFLADARLEGRMHATGAALEGSRTANLLAGQENLLERPPSGLKEFAGRAIGSVVDRARRLTDQRVTEAVGDRLSAGATGLPDELERVLRELEGYSVKQLRGEARRAAVERGAAVATGGVAGRTR